MTALLKRIGAREPAPPWSLTTALISLLVLLAALIGGTFVAFAWLTSAEQQAQATLLGWTFGSGLAAAFVLRSRRAPADRAALRLDASPLPVPLVLLLSVGVAIALDLLSLGVTGQFVPVAELSSFPVGSASAFEWLVAGAFLLVAQPLAEGLILFGLLFPWVRARFGGWAAVIGVALAYAVLHALAYSSANTSAWYAFVLPLLHGITIGAFRAGTGSTRASILAHAGIGVFALAKLVTLG